MRPVRATTPRTALAVCALSLLLAGCGGGTDGAGGAPSTARTLPPSPTSSAPPTAATSAAPTTPPVPSVTPPPPASSRPAATPSRGCAPPAELGAGDGGRTVCVAVGGTVRVRLDGSGERPWRALAVGGEGLRAANSGLVILPGDATGAYRAVAAGTARLSSSRPLCPTGDGRVGCAGLQEWSVTVVVR
ncbi:hypothetical protein [Streptomyces sp. ACT015]|uniref:hypothetical protein n=1 Tax=Streptomyces sp. ACT015 TaxID=3134807 RepID=UPI003D183E11